MRDYLYIWGGALGAHLFFALFPLSQVVFIYVEI